MNFEKDFRSSLAKKNIMFFLKESQIWFGYESKWILKRVSNIIFAIESIMLFTKKISDLKNKSYKT